METVTITLTAAQLSALRDLVNMQVKEWRNTCVALGLKKSPLLGLAREKRDAALELEALLRSQSMQVTR